MEENKPKKNINNRERSYIVKTESFYINVFFESCKCFLDPYKERNQSDPAEDEEVSWLVNSESDRGRAIFASSPLRVFPSRILYENSNQRLLPRLRLGSHEKVSVIRGMNAYPIFDSPLQRSMRRSKSRQQKPNLVWSVR